MNPLHQLAINPPLFNTPCPWVSTEDMLKTLYHCPATGAVTTRSMMLHGYPHDDAVNQYTLFEQNSQNATAPNERTACENQNASLNTIVYSPYSLSEHLQFIRNIIGSDEQKKPFILSITGSSDEIATCLSTIIDFQDETHYRLAVEINLSCPNELGKALPAYDMQALLGYLGAVKAVVIDKKSAIAIGIKLPPFTYHLQFETVINALKQSINLFDQKFCPIHFITSTNTLGNSLVLNDTNDAALASLDGSGIGGMAGVPIHNLSLGNVKTLKSMLAKHDELAHLAIIGVGGVKDKAGFERMRAVGADFVGIATAYGVQGVVVFEKIVQ